MARRVMSEKYNDSCLRIFALIKMFVESDAPFAEVIKLFADENGNLTQKCNVTLNKYMNTLDLCGIKVKKRKNKYYLQKMPYSIHLNEHEAARWLGKEALHSVKWLPADYVLLPLISKELDGK